MAAGQGRVEDETNLSGRGVGGHSLREQRANGRSEPETEPEKGPRLISDEPVFSVNTESLGRLPVNVHSASSLDRVRFFDTIFEHGDLRMRSRS